MGIVNRCIGYLYRDLFVYALRVAAEYEVSSTGRVINLCTCRIFFPLLRLLFIAKNNRIQRLLQLFVLVQYIIVSFLY